MMAYRDILVSNEQHFDMKIGSSNLPFCSWKFGFMGETGNSETDNHAYPYAMLLDCDGIDSEMIGFIQLGWRNAERIILIKQSVIIATENLFYL